MHGYNTTYYLYVYIGQDVTTRQKKAAPTVQLLVNAYAKNTTFLSQLPLLISVKRGFPAKARWLAVYTYAQ